MNIVVLSLPRSGSSYLTKLILNKGFKLYGGKKNVSKSRNILNKYGYFENTKVNLLNDQVIRMYHGEKYSFLYPPSKTKNKANNNFFYDIREENIFIPKDYEKLKKEYNGYSWDVWGLTRMFKKNKWHKCYSKFGLESSKKIKIEKKKILNFFEQNNGFVIKDPRFALCYPFYKKIKNVKFIVLRRNKKQILKSLRRHYGKNLFKKIYLPNSKFVSNHFNYKIKYLNYNKYFKRYQQMIKRTVKNKKYIELNINKIKNKKELSKLDNFINSKT